MKTPGAGAVVYPVCALLAARAAGAPSRRSCGWCRCRSAGGAAVSACLAWSEQFSCRRLLSTSASAEPRPDRRRSTPPVQPVPDRRPRQCLSSSVARVMDPGVFRGRSTRTRAWVFRHTRTRAGCRWSRLKFGHQGGRSAHDSRSERADVRKNRLARPGGRGPAKSLTLPLCIRRGLRYIPSAAQFKNL